MYLIGSGGHARVVVDTLEALGRGDLVVLDGDESQAGSTLLGHPVAHEPEVLENLEQESEFFVAIGDARARRRITEQWLAAGHRPATVIHPGAIVSPHARLGAGTCVLAGAVIQAGAVVGSSSIINTLASADHDCEVGDYAHLAPRSALAGQVRVGPECWIGLGAVVREGITIGARTLVGAGAVVVRDLPADVEAYGVPAQVIRDYLAAL